MRPLGLSLTRAVLNGSDSDSILFSELLYTGELATKLTVAGLVAALLDDTERYRYRMAHSLVRADGVGEWAARLDDILMGVASQHLAPSLHEARRILNERVGAGDWRFEVVSQLHSIIRTVHSGVQALPGKVTLRSWFGLFAELRNKTRGHGALTPSMSALLAPQLDSTIRLLQQNSPVFHIPWAYIHRNLSGKYRVIPLAGTPDAFKTLTTSAAASGPNYPSGVYIWADGPRVVELVHSDLDAQDFLLPNGSFNGKTYELISLISDKRTLTSSQPYLKAAGERPASETQGSDHLDIVGEVFTNIPAVPEGYVGRALLEAEITEALSNDRHPIVTLVGRGGIGKTSSALQVLHKLSVEKRFTVIVWFSARDVDLLTSGPKAVRPSALTEREIAAQYIKLVAPTLSNTGKSDDVAEMAKHLGASPEGATLFVFDNFETLRSPVDLFQWLDMNVRLPNKILITSRFRDFKADFPIEVGGMEPEEAGRLVDEVATRLGIASRISVAQNLQIVDDSTGHPYVIKIILGEIADRGSFTKPAALLVRKEDILDALFERTYANLSPLAARSFLMLSSWKSLVPQIAMEAVLIRHCADGADPTRAIDELLRMSLIERVAAEDGYDFLSIPLTAAIFGRKKLDVSAVRDAIDSDVKLLQEIGVTTRDNIKGGVKPRVEAFFRRVARRVEDGASLEDFRSTLEFIARGYKAAWLLLAEMELEQYATVDREKAAIYVRRFLEEGPTAEEAAPAWQQLVSIYRLDGNAQGAASALIRLGEAMRPPLDQVSTVANMLNNDRELVESTSPLERQALYLRLAKILQSFADEASATDLSRLAWLYLHADREEDALQWAEAGLGREPDNAHCQKLVWKLNGS